MLSTFVVTLETATIEDRRRVYEKLWLELTIVGRMVWAGEFDALEKVEGLKWLNEIQHRVWGAHADPVRYSPTDLYTTIQHHAAQASTLDRIVETACVRSLRALEQG
jgi:hypothetical protein